MMGGRMSLMKGKRAEREIVKALQPVLDKVTDELGVESILIQRNTLQSHKGGYDLVGINWMAPEVKMHETFNIAVWWKQTVMQCEANQEPILFYRKSRVKWRVRMKMYAALNDKRFFCVADISLADFLVYFEHRCKIDLLEGLE